MSVCQVTSSVCLSKSILFVSLQNQKACGIIYCRTRDHVEQVANGLTKQGIKTVAYHAGLKDGERKQVQEDWMSGKYPVISATVSFGMGYEGRRKSKALITSS